MVNKQSNVLKISMAANQYYKIQTLKDNFEWVFFILVKKKKIMARLTIAWNCSYGITNLMSTAFFMWGSFFYDESRRKVEKALEVNFEMYQMLYSIYLSIYLSIYPSSFFLFEKQLNVFVYTEKNKSVSF